MGVVYRPGGLIGPDPGSTAAAASGIWRLYEVDARTRLSTWPVQIVRSNLALHYDAGVPEGTNLPGSTSVFDLSATGATGTMNGGGYASDNGGTFTFDGVDDWISSTYSGPNNLMADGNGAWSVEAWFSFVAPVTAGNGYVIVGRAGGLGTGGTFGLGLAGTGAWGGVARTANNLCVLLRGAATQISGGSFSGVGWKQVVVAWTGAVANVYVNGSFVQTATVGTAVVQVQNVQVGRIGAGNYYRNHISNVKIYDTALTATQVAQNFNALRNRYGV